MLKRLHVPITMTGGYSYDCQAAELFYAAFKKDDVNPERLPLGKQNFQNVLQLVVDRCKKIPKHHLILNWHHCLLMVYKYLTFFRI